jgi:hypothetical protein
MLVKVTYITIRVWADTQRPLILNFDYHEFQPPFTPNHARDTKKGAIHPQTTYFPKL